MRQKGAPAGYVRRARFPAPLRAVGEGEAHLAVNRSSHAISPLAPPAFTGFRATMKRADFCKAIGWSSLLPPAYLSRGTLQNSHGKVHLDVLPLSSSIPLRSRLDLGRRVRWHAHPIGPACTRLYSRSVLQPAFRLLPHTASRRVPLPSACGCKQLAPKRTSTSYPRPMPGTPRMLASRASPTATKALDPDRFPYRPRRHAV